MTSTVFSSGTTIASTWLNDVNTAVYKSASGIPNTVNRTLLNKLADQVSVKDFGATGDGTTDDTVAIKLALANSFNVFFPAGIYKITDGLAPRDYTVMRGAGRYNTFISLFTNDVDAMTIGWGCLIEDMEINSQVATGTKGCLRCFSITNSNIPAMWQNTGSGGLSYENILDRVTLRGGQAYNLYGTNVGYMTWRDTWALISKGGMNVLINGVVGVGATTLTMEGTNKITACLNGDGMSFTGDNGAHRILGIFEGNKGCGLRMTGILTAITIAGDSYFENNFALGASLGAAEVIIGGTAVNGFNIEAGVFYRSNNSTYGVSAALTTGNTNFIRGFGAPALTTGPQARFNVGNGFLLDIAQEYLGTPRLVPTTRRNTGIFATEAFQGFPYTINQNPVFNAWSGTPPDNWTNYSAQLAVKSAGGFFNSAFKVICASYPSGIVQASLQTRLPFATGNFILVIVGRNGRSIGPTSPGFNGTDCTRLVYTAGATTTIQCPDFVFGTDWTVATFDLTSLNGGDFPAKSAITAMTLNVLGSNITEIGFVGLYDSNARTFIPSSLF